MMDDESGKLIEDEVLVIGMGDIILSIITCM